ncbi:MAG: acetylxylan esterase [Mediterranea sp.]|nr:acetylxylan esterase [Mediterranea sp.]
MRTYRLTFLLLTLLCLTGRAQTGGPTLDQYFSPATADAATPDNDGFIRRWMLLEPIDKPNRSNTVFTDSYLREAFYTEYFKEQLTLLPKDGQKVKVGKQKLTWHALDSKLFNVKLFRLATGLNKQMYGVLFWAVTVIDSPQEQTVRLAVGSNSASMWWLNGEEAVLLSGDRRMVKDDCTSARLTLKRGRNVLRGSVINGPGMSDFCVRFIDEKGNAVTNLSIQ